LYKKNAFLKTLLCAALFLFSYIILPLYITFSLKALSFKYLLAFYLVNIIVITCLVRKNSGKIYRFEYQIQVLQEKLNILNDRNSSELKNNASLEAKIIRYNSLKKLVEELNESLNFEHIANIITLAAFSLVSNNKGTCILYLVDKETQKLALFKTKKEDRELVVKAKEGDIFDFWVARHAAPLLVENIRNDFRFDPEKLKIQDLRPILSLISSPFISDHRFLGLLRLDSPKAHTFSQDDLRLLATISDLGSVALENSELFAQTQNLAMHDGLTSLYTKGYFLERLKQECIRFRRRSAAFSLLMIDIDSFKNYNDNFGHTAGDIVLRKISEKLTSFFKKLNPIIGRFGGEEFCVIIPDADKKKAFSLADMMRQELEKEKIILRRQETNITVSVGIATFPFDANVEDDLIQKADQAMYKAKKAGRNQVCCI